ncbi:MAG: hypothetical protein U0746_16760 [Gemmataceae bacterium]
MAALDIRRLTVVALACLTLALPGCKRNVKITQANLDKITEGMSLPEVEAILGPGETDPDLNMAEGSSVAGAVGIGGDLGSMTQGKSAIKVYKWGSETRFIRVVFLSGKVTKKEGQGLN